MKILLLNSVDNLGGAAKSAQRLCKGLQARDIQATMLVQRKLSVDSFSSGPTGFWKQWFSEIRPHLDASPVCLYPNRTRAIFSPAFLPESMKQKIKAIGPDLLHLHWVCEGFIRLETLSVFERPIVWTLHDSWPFTGGCHLPSDCTRYESSCGKCPTLGSSRFIDLSSWVWKRKREVFKRMNLTLVAPSSWMADKARSSSLFGSSRIEVIPNGLDTTVYKPHDRQYARQLLGLPQDKKIIAFNAMAGCEDPNKGFGLLMEAIRLLKQSDHCKDSMLMVVGSRVPEATAVEIPYVSLGRLADDVSIVLAHSAADVSVVPSLQENLPYSIMESMACGTPCVSFRVGGIPDLIDHRENGYLVDPYDVLGLAAGIAWGLNEGCGAQVSERASKKIHHQFSIHAVATRHIRLYEELTSTGDKPL